MEMLREPLALSLDENRAALSKKNGNEHRAKATIAKDHGEGNRHERRKAAAVERLQKRLREIA